MRLRVESQGSATWDMESRTFHSEAVAEGKALPWGGARDPQGNEKDPARDMTPSMSGNKTMRYLRAKWGWNQSDTGVFGK